MSVHETLRLVLSVTPVVVSIQVKAFNSAYPDRRTDANMIPKPTDLASIAKRLRLNSVEHLKYLVKDPRNYKILAKLEFKADPSSRGEHVPTPKLPGDVPYPTVNVPDQTDLPTHRPDPDHFVLGQDVVGVPPEFLPPHRFNAWDLFKLEDRHTCMRELGAWKTKCAAQWRKIYAGESPARLKPLIWRSDVFNPWAVGRLWDTRKWDRSYLQDVSRSARLKVVRTAAKTGTAIDPEAITKDLRAIDYIDREWMDVIQTGLHSKAEHPFAVVLCGPSSTLGHAGAIAAVTIASNMTEAGERGTCVDTDSLISSIPFTADAIGAAVKKGSFPVKTRQTTDKSGPRIETADGKPLAFNANVSIHDTDLFPTNRLVRIGQVCQGMEAIDAIYHALEPHLTDEQRSLLEPCMLISDFSGYFTQFMADRREHCRNGSVYLKPGADKLSSNYSERVQFGGAHAPTYCCRGTNAVTTFLRHEMGTREEEWRRDANWEADSGHRIARDICPRQLVDILRSRDRLGEGQNIASFISGYVDDLINGLLGPARGVALADTLLSMARRWQLPTAEEKGQLGSAAKAIGFQFALRAVELQHTRNRRDLLDRWTTRLKGASTRQEWVSKAEIQSFTGTWSWAAQTIPGSEPYLRRIHGLPFRKDKFGKYYYQLLIDKATNLDLLRLRDLLRESSGVTVMIRERVPVITNPLNLSWTDASREASDAFSGMGGFDLRVGLLWVYQFDQRQTDELPIHILEAIADLVGLALGTYALINEELLRFCDNKAVVDTISYGKPSDPGMADFLRLRQELERPRNLTAHSRHVTTEANTVADAPSRGQIKEAIAELNRKGWGNYIHVVDLRKEPNRAPPDLDALFEHFISVERHKRALRRATGKGK